MTPQFRRISSIAVELGRDRRTVAKALRRVRPDRTVQGRPCWLLSTSVAALDRLGDGAREPAHGVPATGLVFEIDVGECLAGAVHDREAPGALDRGPGRQAGSDARA